MTALVVRGIVAALVLAVAVRVDAGAQPTGRALPGLEAFDQTMTALLKKWDVIERVGGMPYETFVRTRILEPVGATGLKVGRKAKSAVRKGPDGDLFTSLSDT